MKASAYATDVPVIARIVDRIQETPLIFTITLELIEGQESYGFAPGQFNMLYAPGVGEVPISIVSDPDEPHLLKHTIRKVGRVTACLHDLRVGDVLGLRGPFGRGWPVGDMEGRDVLIVTGGLGCAPVVSVINYIRRRKERYGRLMLVQGVKHSDDLLWREQYERWEREDGMQVLLAADVADKKWRWHVGLVTELLDQADFDSRRTGVVMCGPGPMMHAAANKLTDKGVPADAIWLSLERNMQCAVGWCGHCQIGPYFVCHDGPVFAWSDVGGLLQSKGF